MSILSWVGDAEDIESAWFSFIFLITLDERFKQK